MSENEKIALEILQSLKEAKPETRDAWKTESLKKWPEAAEFIEQAYKLANK